MLLKIKHSTTYIYSEPVFLEPHLIYLSPLQRPNLALIEFDIKITPTPSGIGKRMDAENNMFHQTWYNEKVLELSIQTSLQIESSPINPFDFIIQNSSDEFTSKALNLYKKNSQNSELSPAIIGWARQYTSSKPKSVAFLSALCNSIYNEINHTLRYEPTLLSPDECFNSKSGSCRDLSWLMICILREFEIPARFVSGYSYNPDAEGHELHAWIEAWLDGAGWIGLDPSMGLFITDAYIPLAISFEPSKTLPVQGNYRGDATSVLETSVEIAVDD